MKSDVFHVKPMWLFCTEKIEHFVCYIKSGYGSEIPIIDQLVQSSLETCGYDDISLQGSSIVSLHVEGNVRFQFKTISSMKPRSHPWISNRRDLDCTHTHTYFIEIAIKTLETISRRWSFLSIASNTSEFSPDILLKCWPHPWKLKMESGWSCAGYTTI